MSGSGELASQDAGAQVFFMPAGKRGCFAHGTSLLQAARELGVDVDSVCGGRGLCGRCAVNLTEGTFAKHQIESSASHASPPVEAEISMQAQGQLPPGRRLACSTRIWGDLVVDVPAESQVHRQVVRKTAEARDVLLNPLLRLYYVEVAEADMNPFSGNSGDWQRLCDALEFEWGLVNLRCDLAVLQILQKTLRQADWKVTVAALAGRGATEDAQAQVIAIWPGLRQRAWGIACDIGSTTLAVHVCDLESGEVLASTGTMNPQIRFGEDLMSRISYLMMQTDSLPELCGSVRERINELTAQAAREAGGEVRDILLATFVGNPVMTHLFLGVNPVELGGAPFALSSSAAQSLRASELALNLHSGARTYVLPCIAGHVGADAAGMILAERPDLATEVTLLVDVGTNAEIVLGNEQRLLACSSPTGPAFEGAQIECGQRAAPGAIERVRIDSETLQARFKLIGCEHWSDTPEFATASRQEGFVGVTGICGSGMIEAVGEMFLAGIIDADGRVRGEMAEKTPLVQPNGRSFAYKLAPSQAGSNAVRITQNDVRAIQLAKAALYAGVQLLMLRLGVQEVDCIRLAGAFGSHIDVKYAMLLGMIPDCDLDKVSAAGNAAGVGARIALLDKTSRADIEALVERIEKIETAVEPRFQDLFVAAMAIPHRSDPFVRLRGSFPFPKATISQGDSCTTVKRLPRRFKAGSVSESS